ncbi:MAG: 2-amino-4-hydroxy-6-hydroxymethyldihydropteridine diphosphokinase [Saprospiraceae bacterium]
MHKVFFSIGGNLGNRQANLVTAITEITKKVGAVSSISSIYETKAWGVENQPDFLNQVLLVTTKLSPMETLETVLNIELEMGRVRAQKWYTRIIDIDLLFFDNQVINSKKLTIPHPFIAKRNFVLAPLAEIAPDFIHPILQKSIKELYKKSPDPLKVEVIKSRQ